MFINDDRETAKLGDRVIAGVIGGFCGFLFGGLVAFLVSRFLGWDFGLQWWVALAFGIYAFSAPARSTQLWTEFWEHMLSLLGRHTPRL